MSVSISSEVQQAELYQVGRPARETCKNAKQSYTRTKETTSPSREHKHFISMDNQTDRRQRMQPLVAARALRELIRDPEQTEQVFIIIRAMSGDSLERSYQRFLSTNTGCSILREQRKLRDRLDDRSALANLPSGSFGAAYLAFVEAGQLTAGGLVEASEVNEDLIEDPGLRLYAERLRDQHDLWHTLTGYGRDPFGEACLLAFTYAQTRNRGLGTIALIGMLKLSRELGAGVLKAMWQGFRDGRRAAWLPAQEWESLLERPLDEVRQQLHIERPDTYREILKLHMASA